MSIATVVTITGQAWARDPDGNLRELAIGDVLQEGETLVTSTNGSVQLDFDDGLPPTLIGGNEEVAITNDVDAENAPTEEETVAQDGEVEALLSALEEEDGDLLDLLEATAAGGGAAGGGGGGGADFVQLARIEESVQGLQFDYAGGVDGGPPAVEFAEAPVEDDAAAEDDEPDSDPIDISSITLSVDDAGTINEGGVATFNVTLGNAVDNVTTLTFSLDGAIEADDVGTPTATIGGTAVDVVANDDGSFSFEVPAGTTDGIAISVPTNDDAVFEGQEAFTLTATLSGATAAGNALPTGITDDGAATIVDDGTGTPDEPETLPDNDIPTLTVSDAGTIDEGDAATFDVTLGNAVDNVTTLTFSLDGAIEADDVGTPTATIGGTAVDVVANDDGSFSFEVPAGTTDGIAISVPTNDDAVFEGQEAFTLTATLSGATAAGNALPTGITDDGTATIVDDGSGPGETPDNDTPTIEVTGGGVVNEGGTATFGVTLSNALEADHDLTIDTVLGNAEAGDLGAMTVSYDDADGNTQTLTANANGSYTVPAGITALSVSVETTQDEVYEGEETFSLTAGSALVGNDSADATIVDDGSGPGETPDNDTPTIEVTGGGVVNEGGTATFGVTLSNALEADHDLTIDTVLGNAEAGDLGAMTVSYDDADGNTQTLTANANGSYTVPAGITALSVSVETTQDEVYEGEETFSLTAGSALVGNDSADATIVDDGSGPGETPDNDTPTIEVTGGGVVNEGGTATFGVTLSNALEADHDLTIDTVLGNAEAGDLGAMTVSYDDADGNTQTLTANANGSYTVPAGITALSVSVETTQDEVYEGEETFSLTAGSALVGNDSADATIVDDGSGPGETPDNDTPTIEVTGGGVVNEGGTATFGVTLSNALEADHDLTIDTVLGNAEAGDLGAMTVSYDDADGNTQTLTANANGSYTVPAGITALSVSVETTQDEVYEGEETFSLTAGSALVGNDSADATIVDDGSGPGETPDNDTPTIEVTGGGVVNEGGTATFGVTLSNALEADHDLTIDTVLGNAEAGDLGAMTVSYDDADGNTQTLTANANGSYTVPAGITALSVSVETTQDEVYEGEETFSLTAGSALVGNDSADATIVDDGSGPGETPDNDTPTIEVTGGGVVNEGGTATFGVTLSNALEADHDLTIDTVLGNAEAGDLGAMTVSYDDADGNTQTLTANANGSYTVPAGITALSVSVETTQDEVYEGEETFSLTAGSALVGNDSADATIVDVEDMNNPPDAQDDTNEVAFDETLNVGEDGGVLSNDTDPDDDTLTVTEVEGSAANVGSAIQGQFGTLTLNSDGSYDYVSNQPQPVLYGFVEGDNNLQGNLLNSFTLDTDALQRVQVTANKGVGVTGSDDGRPVPEQINDNGEVMVADMGDSIEGAGFSFGVSNLFNNESGGESGAWYTYNEAGELVGSGTFGPDDVAYQNGSNNVGRVNVSAEDAGDFRYIAFEGLAYENSNVSSDGGDYFLTDITLQESFDYTITDGEGGSDSATLTVDSTSNLAGYEIPLTLDGNQAALVDEDGLDNGIAGGPGDREGQGDDESTFTGKIGVAGAESLDFAGMNGQTATVGQEQVSYGWANGVLTATISASPAEGREGEALFTVELDDAGNYTVTLLENVLHDTLDGEAGDNTENDASVALEYTAQNADGETQSGTLTLDFNDDTPTVEEADTVAVTNEGIPNIYVGNVDFTGNNGSQSQFSFADGNVVVTGKGFESANDLDLVDADVNQSGQGLGVDSDASPYHNLDNEVDFRKTADDEASETLTIALQNGQVAYGANIEFAKMFDGSEEETGIAEFYRDGELISTQSFSSDADGGNYADNFQVKDGGFDTIVLKADDNGNGPNQNDNSDFTVSSIEFTGSTGAPIGYAKSSLDVNYGADGPGSLALTGLASEVALKDGTPITDIDTSDNAIVARDDSGELVFQLQLTPATGQWEFFQYQQLASENVAVGYQITDADGDSVNGSFALAAMANNAPESTDDEVATNEDEVLILSQSDFGEFSDADSEDQLAAIRIDTLPDANAGVLTLNGETVQEGDEISTAAIDNGELQFKPATNSDTDTALKFSVSDGFAWSEASYTLTLNVDAVANAPTVSLGLAESSPNNVSTIVYSGYSAKAFNGNNFHSGNLSQGNASLKWNSENEQVIETAQGLGVQKNAHESEPGVDDNETLLLDLAATTTSATFALNMPVGSGAISGSYSLFNSEGNQVGQPVDISLATNGTLTIQSDTAFQYVAFEGHSSGNGGSDSGYLVDPQSLLLNGNAVDISQAGLGEDVTETVAGSYDHIFDLSASLQDQDGSETLSLIIDGLPEGATLDQGEPNDDGSWTLTVDGQQFNGQVTVTAPAAADSFTLTAIAVATESNPGTSDKTVAKEQAEATDTAEVQLFTTASDEQALTSDGSLVGNLLDNVDFGSDGQGENGGLKSMKVGDTSYTPDGNGDITINNVLGGTLNANLNTGEYSLTGAVVGTATLQVMAEDTDGDEVAFDFDITSAGNSTTTEIDDFNGSGDGWKYQGEGAFVTNGQVTVETYSSIFKKFSGFEPGETVEIRFDAMTSTGWENSDYSWGDSFTVDVNGENKVQQKGSFDGKINFEATADEIGDIELAIGNKSSAWGENLYIDNVELTSGSSVGSILVGDDDSAEQFVLDDSNDDSTISNFDVENDVLDLSDLLDDGDTGTMDDYFVTASDEGSNVNIEITQKSGEGGSKNVTLKDVSAADLGVTSGEDFTHLIQDGKLDIE
ncbi:retention module-containing protein [Halomonas sp. SH5A2]|uniref:retention module-containing protein n=1 Tax=Halomonas sp. SH5A2 TaxID=2749040 RepID=UPI001641FD54|nr:retention module-containing protein [Halomonas sp. SH5A2]QNI02348.1 retention module-containing protein [Halomonas sp. SH5A2]